jgi:hypothetical protein
MPALDTMLEETKRMSEMYFHYITLVHLHCLYRPDIGLTI